MTVCVLIISHFLPKAKKTQNTSCRSPMQYSSFFLNLASKRMDILPFALAYPLGASQCSSLKAYLLSSKAA